MIQPIERIKEVIFHHQDLMIIHSSYATEDVFNILDRTFYGTNGLSYRHCNVRERADKTLNPNFFTLYKDSDPIGTFCLSERTILNKNYPEKGFYGRYLSILPNHSGKGYGKLLKEIAYGHMQRVEPRSFVIYSYIEEANNISLNLSKKQGNEMAGIYEVLSFSRFEPKLFSGFSRLENEKIPEAKKLLKDYYQNHQLVTLDYVGVDSNYFVLRKNGEIIAGVQAVPAHWQFKNMPGFSGFMAKNILPFIPQISRLFNADDYQFIAFDSVYAKPGHEYLLIRLFESVLAAFNLHSGLFYGDPKSTINRALKESDRGFLSRIESRIQPMIMISSHHSHSQWQSKTNDLHYVSAFDQV